MRSREFCEIPNLSSGDGRPPNGGKCRTFLGPQFQFGKIRPQNVAEIRNFGFARYAPRTLLTCSRTEFPKKAPRCPTMLHTKPLLPLTHHCFRQRKSNSFMRMMTQPAVRSERCSPHCFCTPSWRCRSQAGGHGRRSLLPRAPQGLKRLKSTARATRPINASHKVEIIIPGCTDGTSV